MFINIYNTHAEQKLLMLIAQRNKRNSNLAVLHFRLSQLEPRPREEDLLHALRPTLLEKSSAIYFLHDGDIFITWYGSQRSVIDAVTDVLYKRFCPNNAEKNLHKYYVLQGHGAELKQLLLTMLKTLPKHLQQTPADASKLEFTPTQLQHMKKYAAERHTLKQPNILIVEDQEFSLKLLEGLLSKHYTCYSALNAFDATTLYAEHAPCITFLDIQLPDKNGHDLAAFIKKHDPESYIVMVTANHYDEDAEHALNNHVQGFIIKPYSQQKIMDSIHKYQNKRKAS